MILNPCATSPRNVLFVNVEIAKTVLPLILSIRHARSNSRTIHAPQPAGLESSVA
jgi:hypothetical protein